MKFVNHIEHPLIKKVNDALDKCTLCKDRNTRGGNFISHNTFDIDYFFISQNPGFSNWNKQCHPSDIIPFGLHEENQYHQFFDFFVEEYEKKFKSQPKCYITNIVKCVTYKNSIPDQEMTDNCVREYLLKEIMAFKTFSKKPFEIFVVGKASNDTMINLKKKYSLNIPFKHIYHPGYLNRQGPEFVKNYAKKLFESKTENKRNQLFRK